MAAYTCPNHSDLGELDEYCPGCLTDFETRRDAREMTGEERVAAFDAIPQILTQPFANIQQRIEELVGRPVWTHELAYLDSLREEILMNYTIGDPGNYMERVLEKIPADKQVIVVTD